VGWAESAVLDERTRGLCRTVPLERRMRLRVLERG
jgi:hypothetical protein